RIYAEDPENNFLPSTGTLEKHRIPTGTGVRVDAGIEEGQAVTINYDPMISKLTVHGTDREDARKKMLRALDEYEIVGCRTTIPFCTYTLNHEAFITGKYDTHFVQDHFDPAKLYNKHDSETITLAAALLKASVNEEPEAVVAGTGTEESMWWKSRR
ncbi:MAG: biotin carboxylase, partial [Balneolales bacterium]|nr:biotin carboxylase [Balneolales bacterium]